MGETQISELNFEGKSFFSHPIDVHYNTAAADGWPFLVCELWDRSYDGNKREFIGCGSVFLPSSVGENNFDIILWRPQSTISIDGAFTDGLLAGVPDVKQLRELIVYPYLRPQIRTDTVGSIRVSITTITSGFDRLGVRM